MRLSGLVMALLCGCARFGFDPAQAVADAGLRESRRDTGPTADGARDALRRDGAVDAGRRDGAVDALRRDGAVDAGRQDGAVDALRRDLPADSGNADAASPVPPLFCGSRTASTGSCACDRYFADFEPPTFALGVVHNQDGWSSLAAAGLGCGLYDHAIGASSEPSFGRQSLRLSDAVTDCLGDQTFTASTSSSVGESTARTGGLASETRRSRFVAQWSFISATPTVEQPGLHLAFSPVPGNGARMFFLALDDTPNGIEIDFQDFRDVNPYGAVGSESKGCASSDRFRSQVIATTDRSKPHTIRMVLETVEGPHNDVVEIYLDGALIHSGTSWEDYFRWCPEQGATGLSWVVDSLVLHTWGTAHPANAGKGFFVDNLTVQSCD